MNPIKTPQEMLAEMAGIPRMAGGKAVVGQFDKMIASAIAKYKQLNKRAPSAQEVEQLKSHVQGLSNPTSPVLRSGMSAQPRASYELATDPNLINPDLARDEFLTKMTTGRTTKGTNLRPLAQDINDPSVVKNIEAQQMSGALDEAIPGASRGQSTTPSADYFAQQSSAIENEALSGGTFDKLKQEFVKRNGRYPDQDELNEMIAEFNPARHQYGSQGIGIMSQRPPTAKGMSDFRNAARNEGVEESYLTKRQGNYPQYIQDELTIQRGEVPLSAMKEAKKKRASGIEPTDFYVDENGNLVKVYPTMKAEGGQITPEEMRHRMIVGGQTPEKFSAGGQPGIKELDQWTASQNDPYNFKPTFQAYEPGFRERATDAIAPYLEKIGMSPRRAYEQASTITGKDTLLSPTTIFDPIAPFEAAQDLAQGNPVGAGLTLAGFIPGAAAATKAIKKTKKRK
jgi:hypothetical protein